MLETIREYARERLDASNDERVVLERQIEWMRGFTEQIWGAPEAEWIRRVEPEKGNIHLSIDAAIRIDAAGEALVIVGRAWRLWHARGRFAEGLATVERVLAALPGDAEPAAHARALGAAGSFLYEQGRYEESRRFCEQALAEAKRGGAQAETAIATLSLGLLALASAGYDRARELFEATIESAGSDALLAARARHGLGLIRYATGDPEGARPLLTAALDGFRAAGHGTGAARSLIVLSALLDAGDARKQEFLDEALALARAAEDTLTETIALMNLGHQASLGGRWDEARGYMIESLDAAMASNDRPNLVYTIEELAAISAGTGGWARAAQLHGAAESMREDLSMPLPPSERALYDERVARVREAAGDEYEALHRKGSGSSLEGVIARSCLFPFAGPDLHVVGNASTGYLASIWVDISTYTGQLLLRCETTVPSNAPSCQSRTYLLPNLGGAVRLPLGAPLVCNVYVFYSPTTTSYGCGSRTL